MKNLSKIPFIPAKRGSAPSLFHDTSCQRLFQKKIHLDEMEEDARNTFDLLIFKAQYS